MPADRAGLRANDKIVAAEGQPITTWPQLVEIIKGSNGNLLHLTAEREGKELQFEMKPILGPNELGQTVYVIGAARIDPRNLSPPRSDSSFPRRRNRHRKYGHHGIWAW